MTLPMHAGYLHVGQALGPTALPETAAVAFRCNGDGSVMVRVRDPHSPRAFEGRLLPHEWASVVEWIATHRNENHVGAPTEQGEPES